MNDGSLGLTYRLEPPALRSTLESGDRIAERTMPLVLCLHGWGMDGDWFARLTQGLFDVPALFVYPTAPKPVTKDDGSAGWSWYDYDGDSASFVRELAALEVRLLEFLKQLESRYELEPTSRALVGFSQGGYGGSYIALRNPTVFRALAISGARIKDEALGPDLADAARSGFRVLACHGNRDPHVSKERARASIDALGAAGIDTRWEEFDAGHSLGRSQIRLIRDWLAESL
ncbi:MAG: alpha/beta hydrolase-fold protein [Candidatus Eisenbacteria bacterium]